MGITIKLKGVLKMDVSVISRLAQTKFSELPLVFVHGACHGAWCWEKYYLDYFSQKGYDCYALDLRGHGNSEGKERLNEFSLGDYVEDVLQVMSGLKGKPILIGHSMGGAIVQKLIGDHQNMASGAVLLAPAVAGGFTYDEMMQMLPPETNEAVREKFMNRELPEPEEMVDMFFNDRLTAEEMDAYTALIQAESAKVMDDMYSPYTEHYSDVKIPVLVIGSSGDKCIPLNALQRTATAYGGEAVVMSDMCHDMMLDPDWKAGAEKILAFIAKLGGVYRIVA
jgi:pimeloyl-ACP methyl ester carboxylesterase